MKEDSREKHQADTASWAGIFWENFYLFTPPFPLFLSHTQRAKNTVNVFIQPPSINKSLQKIFSFYSFTSSHFFSQAVKTNNRMYSKHPNLLPGHSRWERGRERLFQEGSWEQEPYPCFQDRAELQLFTLDPRASLKLV